MGKVALRLFFFLPCQYHCTNAPHSSSYICYSHHKYKQGKPGNLPKSNALLEKWMRIEYRSTFTSYCLLENQDQHFAAMFTLRTACFPYFLDYSSACSDPPQPPPGNQPTVRMQSLYVSVATPLYALCISIALDKHGGDA